MSYLQDSLKRKKKIFYSLFILFFLIIVIFLRNPIYNIGRVIFSGIGGGIWSAGNAIGGFFGSIGSEFRTKNYLYNLNKNLITENDSLKRELLDRNILFDENTKLKEMFGRKSSESKLVLGNILVKPNRSLYDTLVLDVGIRDGIKDGQKVFSSGVTVGVVYETVDNNSKVKLYSTNGEKMDVVLSGSDIFMQATGRGGGNFEITVPTGIDVKSGSEIYLPGLMPSILGIVDSKISAPNDLFQKVIVRSTINFNHIKWVEIRVN